MSNEMISELLTDKSTKILKPMNTFLPNFAQTNQKYKFKSLIDWKV